MAASFPSGSTATPLLSVLLLLAAMSLAGCTNSHLRFYIQEVRTGPNATVVKVASITNGTDSLGVFGNVFVFDNPLTEGPDASSKLIGREQGLGVVTSRSGDTLLTDMNFIFTAGPYAGSSLAVVGAFSLSNSLSERSVVGGTGRFRLLRGYVLSKVLSDVSGRVVLEIEVNLTL